MHPLAHKEVGAKAEELAHRYLTERGLKTLVRNYRCRAGELDLVMLDGSVLALIEVRLRADDRFSGASASVDRKKQRRIVLAAQHLLITHKNLAVYRARFDVIAISQDFAKTKIEWIRDAFSL